MSIHSVAAVANLRGVPSSCKLVLFAMASLANALRYVEAPIDEIADVACLSPRSTRTAIRALENLKLIETEQRLGAASIYRLAQ